MTAHFENIKTWRERIGQTADFPLHVPTDVERAMVAEIAELRAIASAVSTITLTGHQLVSALDLLAPGLPRAPEELDGDLTFGLVRHKDDEGKEVTGMCCWSDDTDGVLPLDEFPVEGSAAPMVAGSADVAPVGQVWYDREDGFYFAKIDAQDRVKAGDLLFLGVATVKAIPSEALISAARDVVAERSRQVEKEGWTPEHDDKYRHCELARAAATYAVCSDPEQLMLCGALTWPWKLDWWKRTTYRRDLIKSGALILAEIERIDRAAQLDGKTGGAA